MLTGECQFGELTHAVLRAGQERPAFPVTQEVKAEAKQRVWNVGRARDGMNTKLDGAIVKPLPHFPVHLASLDVALQGSIVPAPYADVPLTQHAGLLIDIADPDSCEEVQDPERLELKEHVPAL
jgi:hypothetical protein